MTSKILGVREIRFNRSHSKLRYTRISLGFLTVKNSPLTITSGLIFGEITFVKTR